MIHDFLCHKFFLDMFCHVSEDTVVRGFRGYTSLLLLRLCFVWPKGNHTHQAILASDH